MTGYQLQKDLDKLVNLASEWQMKCNASKCYLLRIANKKKPVLRNYTMHDQILENVDQNPYLGVIFLTRSNGIHTTTY